MMLTKDPNIAAMPMTVAAKAMFEKYADMLKFLFGIRV
jgi:hypothetical protein